jgi:THAP4-like, heme-binding beta-barrel domain
VAREAAPVDTALLPPAVEPLSFLLGTWTGQGRGAYPTIDDFVYAEETTFLCPGKPVVAYRQQTWVPPGGPPSHAEVGYLRPVPDAVELVLAQPSGVVEMSRGTLNGTRLELVTLTVVTTPTAKSVGEVRRVYERRGEILRTRLDMAAVAQRLGFHCESELRRAT